MASISITIPNGVVDRVLDALCANHGYHAQIDGVDNPETKAQASKRYVKEWVMNHVKAYESRVDSETARLAALAKVDNDIVIT